MPGVVRIVDQAGVFVKKHGLSLVERDAVLGDVGSRFTPIPGKLDIAHSIILATWTPDGLLYVLTDEKPGAVLRIEPAR